MVASTTAQPADNKEARDELEGGFKTTDASNPADMKKMLDSKDHSPGSSAASKEHPASNKPGAAGSSAAAAAASAFVAAKLGLSEQLGSALSKASGIACLRDGDGRCCLHYSAGYGHEDCVDLLLDKGGPDVVRVRDAQGDLPLHMAAHQGHPMCTYNLAKGCPASCLVKNKAGRSPIDVAAAAGRGEVLNAMLLACAGDGSAVSVAAMRQLLAAGAVPDTWAPNGSSALMLAAAANAVAALQVLLDAGATIELQDALGRSALMFAAGSDATAACKALLDVQASLSARDRRGRAALDYAPAGSESGKLLQQRLEELESVANELQQQLLKEGPSPACKVKGKGPASTAAAAAATAAAPAAASSAACDSSSKKRKKKKCNKAAAASGTREAADMDPSTAAAGAQSSGTNTAAAAALVAAAAATPDRTADGATTVAADEQPAVPAGSTGNKGGTDSSRTCVRSCEAVGMTQVSAAGCRRAPKSDSSESSVAGTGEANVPGPQVSTGIASLECQMEVPAAAAEPPPHADSAPPASAANGTTSSGSTVLAAAPADVTDRCAAAPKEFASSYAAAVAGAADGCGGCCGKAAAAEGQAVNQAAAKAVQDCATTSPEDDWQVVLPKNKLRAAAAAAGVLPAARSAAGPALDGSRDPSAASAAGQAAAAVFSRSRAACHAAASSGSSSLHHHALLTSGLSGLATGTCGDSKHATSCPSHRRQGSAHSLCSTFSMASCDSSSCSGSSGYSSTAAAAGGTNPLGCWGQRPQLQQHQVDAATKAGCKAGTRPQPAATTATPVPPAAAGAATSSNASADRAHVTPSSSLMEKQPKPAAVHPASPAAADITSPGAAAVDAVGPSAAATATAAVRGDAQSNTAAGFKAALLHGCPGVSGEAMACHTAMAATEGPRFSSPDPTCSAGAISSPEKHVQEMQQQQQPGRVIPIQQQDSAVVEEALQLEPAAQAQQQQEQLVQMAAELEQAKANLALAQLQLRQQTQAHQQQLAAVLEDAASHEAAAVQAACEAAVMETLQSPLLQQVLSTAVQQAVLNERTSLQLRLLHFGMSPAAVLQVLTAPCTQQQATSDAEAGAGENTGAAQPAMLQMLSALTNSVVASSAGVPMQQQWRQQQQRQQERQQRTSCADGGQLPELHFDLDLRSEFLGGNSSFLVPAKQQALGPSETASASTFSAAAAILGLHQHAFLEDGTGVHSKIEHEIGCQRRSSSGCSTISATEDEPVFDVSATTVGSSYGTIGCGSSSTGPNSSCSPHSSSGCSSGVVTIAAGSPAAADVGSYFGSPALGTSPFLGPPAMPLHAAFGGAAGCFGSTQRVSPLGSGSAGPAVSQWGFPSLRSGQHSKCTASCSSSGADNNNNRRLVDLLPDDL